MSGGSYNYLYRFIEDLGDRGFDVGSMVDRLRELDYADVAADVEHALARLRGFADVFQAVEWYDSNDWSKDQVDEAVSRYRRIRAASDPSQ